MILGNFFYSKVLNYFFSIYKKDSKFYHDDDEKPVATKSREKSMTLKDYDRAKIIEKGGIIDEATEDMKFASGIKNYHQGTFEFNAHLVIISISSRNYLFFI